jgi:hypothetical protein
VTIENKMLIANNPFTSKPFVKKWLNHFNANKSNYTFNFIQGLIFVKSKFLPLYINAGKNLTKGISFTISDKTEDNFIKAVILIYDVPDYFTINTSSLPNNIGLFKIKQYPGYMVILDQYKDINHYLQTTFSKNSLSKLNRFEKRLELCFDVNYKMYYGEISKEDYDFIFKSFKELLEKRFTDKQITNNNLEDKEWSFYYDVTLELILEKKASLFVIYQGTTPIGITLSYFSDTILFHGITVFDIDYSKFHLGKIMLKNLFAWCFENGISTFDFSKGHYDYKLEWMNKKYDFEYHLYFNKTSFKSRNLAFCVKSFFHLKQYLREKELNKKLHELTFRLKKKNSSSTAQFNFCFKELEKYFSKSELTEIQFKSKEHIIPISIINEFLFLNHEALRDLEIFRISENNFKFIFKGRNVSKLLIVEKP